MEQKIIGRLCPGQPIRRIGANGDHVQLEAICNRIESHINLLSNRYYPIIIIFDREKREQQCSDIASTVMKILLQKGFGDQDIRVFIADREFEDWILKDPDSICQHLDIAVPEIIGNGKTGLAKLIESKSHYHETTIGVQLFEVVSKATLRDKCPIFAEIYATAVEIGCPAFLAG